MDEFPGNSHFPRVEKSTTEPAVTTEKKVGKIVDGPVKVRKKSPAQRFREVFFSGDGRSVIDFVSRDVLVPAAKDMVADALRETMERLIFGEPRGGVRRSSTPTRTYGSPTQVNYTRYSSARDDPRSRPEPVRRTRSSRDLEQFIVASRDEAEAVLEQLDILIEKYHVASVGDLYGMLGIASVHTDEKWGWPSILGSGVSRVGHGEYRLNLPNPEPID